MIRRVFRSGSRIFARRIHEGWEGLLKGDCAMTASSIDRMALAKIGFFLCREGLVAEAGDVFRGLAESAPERDGPAAGMALCLIIKGDSEGAVKLLDRHLAKGDKCAIPGQLNLYKLLALGMAGRIRDAENLRGEMERKGFAEIARKADAILDEVKKIKTP